MNILYCLYWVLGVWLSETGGLKVVSETGVALHGIGGRASLLFPCWYIGLMLDAVWQPLCAAQHAGVRYILFW